MQLKHGKNAPIRQALAAATSLLLGSNAAEAEVTVIERWKVDAGVLSYSEEGRIDVLETIVHAKRRVGEEEYVTLRLGYDTVSGASPTGASPVQTSTGASGTASMVNFSTDRTSGGLDGDIAVTPLTRLKLSVDHSAQSSYASSAASATLTRDFNQRNTTATLGLGYSRDTARPQGGIREELACTCSAQVTGASATRDQADLQLGVTQVLSKTMLAQLNYTRSHATGYLTNPYKILSVVHPVTGETLDMGPYTERRPDQRESNALLGQLNQHFGAGVAYASYRYYWDDWDVQSHTFDVKYRQPISDRLYAQPHWRGYMQSAAQFYRPYLVTDRIPEYASADYRLAEMQSYSIGLKLGYRTAPQNELTMRMEYMEQTGTSYPDDAIGVQRQADFFPTLRVRMVHVGYSLAF